MEDPIQRELHNNKKAADFNLRQGVTVSLDLTWRFLGGASLFSYYNQASKSAFVMFLKKF